MYSSGSICLYNESDLRNYGLVFQDYLNTDEDVVSYFNFNELESKVDESGNPRDFNEYGLNAYQHIYMDFCPEGKAHKRSHSP